MAINCTFYTVTLDTQNHENHVKSYQYAHMAIIHLHKGREYMFCGPYVFELRHRTATHVTSSYYASYEYDRFGSPTHAIQRVIYRLLNEGK